MFPLFFHVVLLKSNSHMHIGASVTTLRYTISSAFFITCCTHASNCSVYVA